MPQLLEVYNFLPKESRSLKEKIVEFCQSVQVVEVKTPSQLEGAINLGKTVTTNIKAIEERRVQDKAPYLEKGRLVDEYYKDVTESLKELKQKIAGATREYEKKLEAARLEEQQRLDEIARKKREAEEKKAEEARKKAEELRSQGEEAKAKSLEAKAEIREMKAATIIPAVAQAIKPATTGHSTRRTWKGQITNRENFVIEMVKQGKLELLAPDPVAFNKYASLIRREWIFPGGRVYLEESSMFRS